LVGTTEIEVGKGPVDKDGRVVDPQTDLINSRLAASAQDTLKSMRPSLDNQRALEAEHAWLQQQFAIHGRALPQFVLDRLAAYRAAVAAAPAPNPDAIPGRVASVRMSEEERLGKAGGLPENAHPAYNEMYRPAVPADPQIQRGATWSVPVPGR
jgi:hypothetical protein